MKSKALYLLPLLFTPLLAHADLNNCNVPISGYVASVLDGGSFVVRGTTVHPTKDFRYREWIKRNERDVTLAQAPSLYIGEQVDVCGVHRKGRTVEASTIWLYPRTTTKVTGSAMVDAVQPAKQGMDRHVFRADGYWAYTDSKSVLHLEAPLTSIDQVGANVWVDYRGVQQLDGTVRIEEAFFQQNAVDAGQRHYNSKREFETSEDANEDKQEQGAVSRFFLPLDHARLLTHEDEELEARVTRIGEGLVPAYQRSLSPDDPTRVNFRFQIVDAPGAYWYPMAQRSGIIQIPYKGLKRMQNDAQIAAELAEAMATVLEQQEYRHRTEHNVAVASTWAAAAGGLLVPGLGLAGIAPGVMDQQAESRQQKQSARVSLCLMHDAGYDLTQAPIAWQMLAPRKEKPLEDIKPSERADYLYQVIGTVWSKPVVP